MNAAPIFGVTTIMSFIVFSIVAYLYILPIIRNSSRENALIALIIPHAFRFEGLSFLVPGVVSPSLEPAFAVPAAYGDFGASILGIIAIVALSARWRWAIPLVWVFNIWGFADIVDAVYHGVIFGIAASSGSLGALFFIPTVFVPLLMITHGLIFWQLLRSRQLVHS